MKMPKLGDRVIVYEVAGVTWPNRENGTPVHGTVTEVTYNQFRFLPDEPDLTTNGSTDARNFGDLGWHVDSADEWNSGDFVIQEEFLP